MVIIIHLSVGIVWPWDGGCRAFEWGLQCLRGRFHSLMVGIAEVLGWGLQGLSVGIVGS